MSVRRSEPTAWMSVTLILAGIVGIFWALQATLWSEGLFRWLGVLPPFYRELWQSAGLSAGMLGIGFLAAAINPLRHWPVVLVGFLSKLAGPVALLQSVAIGHFAWKMALIAGLRDVIWLPPLALILIHTYRAHVGSERVVSPDVGTLALRVRTNRGQALLDMSKEQPLLIVFLRYLGCPFCREALRDLQARRKDIERRGFQIVLIHMTDDQAIHEFLYRYSLSDLPRISDKNRALYRAFGLGRGHLWNLIGPTIWIRGFFTAILHRHGIGWFDQDPFQMPGVFTLFQGEILQSFRHHNSSDRPDYVRFIDQSAGEADSFAV